MLTSGVKSSAHDCDQTYESMRLKLSKASFDSEVKLNFNVPVHYDSYL